MNKFSIIIVAAGIGKRMGNSVPKQFLKLENKEIISHTIHIFEKIEKIFEIIIVTNCENFKKMENICYENNFSKIKIVEGGKERQNSVYNGLKNVSKEAKYVLVHDGARPFVSADKVKKLMEEVEKGKSCVLAVPVKDTIKKVKNYEVRETMNREELWSIQTPQGFLYEDILKAYEALGEKIVTDDAMVMESYGKQIFVVEGDYLNIKITTPEDLIMGEAILKISKNS